MQPLRHMKSRPLFTHWLRQRYLQVIMLASLLLVDTVLTYLFIEVYGTAYEQNPFMAPILETRYGYFIIVLLKFMIVLIMSGASYYAYRELHSDKHSEKAKVQTLKLEVWLWYFAMGLVGVLDLMVVGNVWRSI